VSVPLTKVTSNSADVMRMFGNKSTGVVTLIFMSSSLVKEFRMLSQNTEFTNKTRQNNAHQHTEAAIRGAILIDYMENTLLIIHD